MDTRENIERIANEMLRIDRRDALAEYLAEELLKFSMYDLQMIGARARHDIEILPKNYRDKLRPYAEEWFFGRYHALITKYRDGDFSGYSAPIHDIDTYRHFCMIIPEGCFKSEIDLPSFIPERKNPSYSLFYYLLMAYAMFVLEEPGHPAGTPFPGGAVVRKTAGKYYCPIRDKEEEIFNSICNFCPALQDPDYL
ncbi:DUF2115 domain-containing protein [Methanoplanus endosymbiosus]|uniref:UPF0305 protein L6E24_09050 n=1 Tax=Methanoplanus endosymbiosus TaxID=33865 RepID=A0A9E7PK85_9EURY|nr:DUF2115 domain-containing protein [Methanoplanus endosymbiosus]UUX91518.1 DUF2115 domain-containing protein [Methanoplanus endosymbiosus]